MRILIIKTSALGDIIHSLPVLSYLKQAAPEASIDWVVEEAFQELLSGNPLVNRLFTVAFKRWKNTPLSLSTIQEICKLRSELGSVDYDLVFDLQGNTKSGLICWLTRARQKIGFSREYLQEWPNALFTNIKVPFSVSDRHAVQRYLRVVAAPFTLSPEQQEWFADIHTTSADDFADIDAVGDRPIILFHIGTTWQTKLWHDGGWLGLGQELLRRYPAAIIMFSWGNNEERERCERLAGQLGPRARILPRLTLKQFAALLKKCNLMVGGDTGPLHLAAAAGISTVSFYRCTDGARNGPFGKGHGIVQSPMNCTVCMRKSCEMDQACRESISPEMMLESAVIQLNLQGIEGVR